MLVPLVHPVAGEVLDGHRQIRSGLPHSVHESLAHLNNHVRVRAEGAHIGDRVAPVVVDINNRRKSPVAAGRRPLPGAYHPQAAGLLRLASGGHLHLPAEEGTCDGHAVASALQIAGQQQGNPAGRLHGPLGRLDLLRVAAAVHKPAGVVSLHKGL